VTNDIKKQVDQAVQAVLSAPTERLGDAEAELALVLGWYEVDPAALARRARGEKVRYHGLMVKTLVERREGLHKQYVRWCIIDRVCAQVAQINPRPIQKGYRTA
jgi:hypothetical protein